MEDALLTQHPEVLQYLKHLRKGFIQDICPEGEVHMTTAKRLLLDRLCQKVGWSRVIELYLGKVGLVRRDALAKGVLSEMPILTFWANIGNQIRRDLELLGFERKSLEAEVLSAEALMLEVTKEAQDAEVVEAKPEADDQRSPCQGQASTDDEEEVRGGDDGASK